MYLSLKWWISGLCEGRKKFVEQKKCVWSSEFSIFILPFSLLFDASDKYSTQIGLNWFIHVCVSLWFLIYIRKLVDLSERRWIAREQQITIWVRFIVFGCHLSSIQTSHLFITWRHSIIRGPRPSGSVASVSDSWPGGCEFDPRVRRLFFPAYFRLSPL